MRLPRHIEVGYFMLFILAIVIVIFLVECYGIRYIAGLPSLSLLFVPLVFRVWHVVLASPLGTKERRRALAIATVGTLAICAAMGLLTRLRPPPLATGHGRITNRCRRTAESPAIRRSHEL